MPLSNVLSAIRVLLLDTDTLSNDINERKVYLKNTVPGLSQEELEDLAKMPAEKIKIYQNTIFTGESKALRNHFKITLALLEKYWPQAYSENFSLFQFTKSIHKKFPWKNNLTKTLANNCIDFIQSELEELKKVCPEIVDTSQLEYTTLNVKRAQDEEISPRNSIKKEELEKVTVDQMLNLDAHVPKACVFQKFDYNVIATYHFFYSNDRNLPKEVKKQNTFGVCARNQYNLPRWNLLSENLYEFLRQQEELKTFKIHHLAKVFLENTKEDSEQIAFQKFLGEFIGWLGNGVLVVR